MTYVAVVKAAEVGQGNDAAALGWLDSARLGGIFLERKVGPRSVVVAELAAQTTTEMFLVEDDHVVEQLAADGADHALGEPHPEEAIEAPNCGRFDPRQSRASCCREPSSQARDQRGCGAPRGGRRAERVRWTLRCMARTLLALRPAWRSRFGKRQWAKVEARRREARELAGNLACSCLTLAGMGDKAGLLTLSARPI